jgi:hypothetical protein
MTITRFIFGPGVREPPCRKGRLPGRMEVAVIREVRHVIVEAIKAGDKTIEHDETPAIEDKSDRDP